MPPVKRILILINLIVVSDSSLVDAMFYSSTSLGVGALSSLVYVGDTSLDYGFSSDLDGLDPNMLNKPPPDFFLSALCLDLNFLGLSSDFQGNQVFSFLFFSYLIRFTLLTVLLAILLKSQSIYLS